LYKLLDKKNGQLQLDPLSHILQGELEVLKTQLLQFKNRKTEGKKIRSRARWHLFGFKLTAEFL